MRCSKSSSQPTDTKHALPKQSFYHRKEVVKITRVIKIITELCANPSG